MKRLGLIVVMVLAAWTVMAQRSELSGTLSGAEGRRLIMSEVKGGRLVPTDTLLLDAKGRYKVVREVGKMPLFFALAVDGPKMPMVHVILHQKEKVGLDMTYLPELSALRIDKVKGSKDMEVYRQYNVAMVGSMQDPTKRDELPATMEALLRANPKVLMSAFLVTYFESAFEQYADLYKLLRDNLIGDYPDQDFVRHLDSKLRAAIVAGMEAPDIELPDREGVVRRLSDLRGKVVLIDFWASWCRPCRMENPNVVRLYNRFHDKGFEIYSVSLDNSRDAWLKAIETDGLVWSNHVSDLRGWSSAGGRQYGIQSIPSTVLVDPEGKVLARNLRGAELERKLEEIFSE